MAGHGAAHWRLIVPSSPAHVYRMCSNGPTTVCGGSRPNTAASSSCTCPPIKYGCPTSYYTISAKQFALAVVPPSCSLSLGVVCSAHGNPQITIAADALVYYDGTVVWKPPAIYNSFCLVRRHSCHYLLHKCCNARIQINIEYFPYDEQICDLKFGGWTYTGDFLTMELSPPVEGEKVTNSHWHECAYVSSSRLVLLSLYSRVPRRTKALFRAR